MNLDRRLIDILCCPVSRQPLALASATLLRQLNERIQAGEVRNTLGELLDRPLEKALITADQQRIYPVVDGIPALLPESAIAWKSNAEGPGS